MSNKPRFSTTEKEEILAYLSRGRLPEKGVDQLRLIFSPDVEAGEEEMQTFVADVNGLQAAGKKSRFGSLDYSKVSRHDFWDMEIPKGFPAEDFAKAFNKLMVGLRLGNYQFYQNDDDKNVKTRILNRQIKCFVDGKLEEIYRNAELLKIDDIPTRTAFAMILIPDHHLADRQNDLSLSHYLRENYRDVNFEARFQGKSLAEYAAEAGFNHSADELENIYSRGGLEEYHLTRFASNKSIDGGEVINGEPVFRSPGEGRRFGAVIRSIADSEMPHEELSHFLGVSHPEDRDEVLDIFNSVLSKLGYGDYLEDGDEWAKGLLTNQFYNFMHRDIGEMKFLSDVLSAGEVMGELFRMKAPFHAVDEINEYIEEHADEIDIDVVVGGKNIVEYFIDEDCFEVVAKLQSIGVVPKPVVDQVEEAFRADAKRQSSERK